MVQVDNAGAFCSRRLHMHRLAGSFLGILLDGGFSKRLPSALAYLFLSLGLLTPVQAQTSGTGALNGSVTDPSNALVADAHIKVISDATRKQRSITTNLSGFYIIPQLLPGAYNVEVSHAGFKSVRFRESWSSSPKPSRLMSNLKLVR